MFTGGSKISIVLTLNLTSIQASVYYTLRSDISRGLTRLFSMRVSRR